MDFKSDESQEGNNFAICSKKYSSTQVTQPDNSYDLENSDLAKDVEILKNLMIKMTNEKDPSELERLQKDYLLTMNEVQKKQAKIEAQRNAQNKTQNEQNEGDERTQKLRKKIKEHYLEKSKEIQWSNVLGLDDAKALIEKLLICPMKSSKPFPEELNRLKKILLFGLPGVGKTYLARACANEIPVSKFDFDCQNLIRMVFDTAIEMRPSVIFIDDFEKYSSQTPFELIKIELLKQIVRISDFKDIAFMAATNCPWNLEDKILNIFETKIYLPLPDFLARRQMIPQKFDNLDCNLSKQDIDEIAIRLEGFSMADIISFVRDVCLMVVREVMSTNYFAEIMEEGVIKYKAVPEKDLEKWKQSAQIVRKNFMEIEPNSLKLRSLCMEDFQMKLESSKSSILKEEENRFFEWMENLGEEC